MSCPPGYAVTFFWQEPHHREDCSTVPLLDITHSVCLQLLASLSLSLSVTLILRTPSHSLCLHLAVYESLFSFFFLPPFPFPFCVCLPQSKVLSHLCVHLFPLLFPVVFPAISQPTITVPSLSIPPPTKAPLSLFIWVHLFSHHSPLVFPGLLAYLLSLFSQLFLKASSYSNVP